MKKLSVLLCVILTMVLFAGCQSGSIGIIGGSDGPTEIHVTDKDGDKEYRSESEPVKVLMVDGFLYYESGEDRGEVERPFTLEESFAKSVDEFEIPKNNNESNFDLMNEEDRGYRRSFDGETVQIPIEDEWELFKKLYDPEKDLTQYKYIVKVEGEIQYQPGEAEYIVLTNDKKITANQVAKSMLSSNSEDGLDIYIVNIDMD